MQVLRQTLRHFTAPVFLVLSFNDLLANVPIERDQFRGSRPAQHAIGQHGSGPSAQQAAQRSPSASPPSLSCAVWLPAWSALPLSRPCGMKVTSSACSEGQYPHHSVIPQHSLPGYSPVPATVPVEGTANFATAVAKLAIAPQAHAPLPIRLPEEPRIKVRGRLLLQILDEVDRFAGALHLSTTSYKLPKSSCVAGPLRPCSTIAPSSESLPRWSGMNATTHRVPSCVMRLPDVPLISSFASQ